MLRNSQECRNFKDLLGIPKNHKEFRGIPFSIADRSTNLYKILVGKDFIENHLDALIDVSQENIADEDLEAEY